MVALSLHITGRVQGVSFRVYAREAARSLGLTGFAQNLKDGSVRIEVQGHDLALERFVAWCRMGSAAASVTSVSVTPIQLHKLGDFAIR